MKKVMSLVACPVQEALQLNALGNFNRTLPQGALTTFAEGTPRTPVDVDKVLFQRFGIPESVQSLLQQTTYGPAIGFPATRAFIQDKLGLSSNTLFLLNSGKDTTIEELERAASAVRQPLPEVIIVHLDRLDNLNKEAVQQALQEGKIVRITFNDLHSLNLPIGIDIFPDVAKSIYDQALIRGGYIGPTVQPLSQHLLPVLETIPSLKFLLLDTGETIFNIPSIFEPVPTLHDLNTLMACYMENCFMNYKSSSSIFSPSGTFISGGCSGALADIAELTHTTIIPQPFFSPQMGISKSQGSAVITPTFADLLKTVEQAGPNTHILVTFPSNPTGQIPKAQDIQTLCQKAAERGCRLIVDFTYFNMVAPEHVPNFLEAVHHIQNTLGLEHVFIASGSKALGLTKFRVAYVFGTPGLIEAIQEKSIVRSGQIDIISGVAIQEALKSENNTGYIRAIQTNVTNNRNIMTALLESWANNDDQLVISPAILEARTLCDAAKALKEVFEGMKQAGFTSDCITIKFPQGGPYGFLLVNGYEAQVKFGALLKQHNLVLTPGSIFSGDTDPKPTEKHQSCYRLALLNSPYV